MGIYNYPSAPTIYKWVPPFFSKIYTSSEPAKISRIFFLREDNELACRPGGFRTPGAISPRTIEITFHRNNVPVYKRYLGIRKKALNLSSQSIY